MKAVYAAGTDYDNPLSQLKVGSWTRPKPSRSGVPSTWPQPA